MLLFTSHDEILSILCIQFCFMHGLYIYVIKKDMSPCLFFQSLIWKFSGFDQISKNIK